MEHVRAAVQSLNDPTITQIALSDRVSGWHTLSLTGSGITHYVLVSTHACASQLADHSFVPRINNAKVAELGDYEGKLPRLIPVPSRGCFYACFEGTLQKVTWSPGSGAPTLTVESLGAEELNLNDFGVTDSGDILYWPAFREGGGTYQVGEDGEPYLSDDATIHYIMGARLRGGTMSRPFAICEVGHHMHRIRSFGDISSGLRFISSTTVDAATGQGEQWYTNVP